MAVFTVSVKWNDEWFSNLKPLEKLVFLYLTDRCDNAGFFEINKRVDAFLIGISEDDFIGLLKTVRKCYVASKDGKKVWLKNFLKHQRNFPLNPENNSHKQIINIIMVNKENFEYDFNILGANEGLFSPTGKVIVNNSNSKGKVKGRGAGEGFNTMTLPEDMNGLPDSKINSAIEQMKITQQVDIDKKNVLGMWEVFKPQKLTGKKFYENEDAVHDYFLNWLKTQKFNNGPTHFKNAGKTIEFD